MERSSLLHFFRFFSAIFVVTFFIICCSGVVVLAQTTNVTNSTAANETTTTNTTNNVTSTTTTTIAPTTSSTTDIITNATSTTTSTTTTMMVTTTTTATAGPATEPNYTDVLPPLELKIMPHEVTGKEIREQTSVVHLLLRNAQWFAPVGSVIRLQALDLNGGEQPITLVENPSLASQEAMSGFFSNPPTSMTSTTTTTVLSPNNNNNNNTFREPWEFIYANISAWAEPVNQEDEQQQIVQTALSKSEMDCFIYIVSVSEGNLICNGTVFPSETEKLLFILPPFLLRSVERVNGRSVMSTATYPVPQNVPFTCQVFIAPEEYTFQLVRRVSTGILALVALVAIIVGKEPHLHIMSLARMSLIGRVLECSDEVDFVLHPTQIRLGRGIEKGRYFGCLIFNTAITMGLMIGHNIIARVFPRLLPEPPPATQFVIAGALLPGIALAGLKTVTLQSSPVQFFLAVVVMLLFVGAWVGCYIVTSRDKNFFMRYGRWQHKTDPFFMLRWRVFFTSYKAKNRFYVIIEIFVTLFMAIPSGVTLLEWISREESCRYRSIAMLGLVCFDLLLVLVLRPFAIKIDKIAYIVAKLFEVSIAASAVAKTHHLKYGLEIGTLLWMLGALFVAGFQTWRCYSKAQYNSQQNEFFLTTADTADVTFHDLGDDNDNLERELHGRNNNGGSDDDDDEGGGGGGIALPSTSRKAKTTLASLFPNSDFEDGGGAGGEDDDDENYNNYSIQDETSAAVSMLAPSAVAAKARQQKQVTTSYDNKQLLRGDEVAPLPGVGSGFSNLSSAPANSNTSFGSATGGSGSRSRLRRGDSMNKANSSPPAKPKVKPSSPWKNMINLDYEIEMAEFEKVHEEAPKLQLGSGGNNNNNASHSNYRGGGGGGGNSRLTIQDPAAGGSSSETGSIDIPDDPLVDFWDTLIDSSASPTIAMNQVQKSLPGAGGGKGITSKEAREIRSVSDGREAQTGEASGAGKGGGGGGKGIIVAGSSNSVAFTPKIAVRGVKHARKMEEAQPCRLQDSMLEGPAEAHADDDDDDKNSDTDNLLGDNNNNNKQQQKKTKKNQTLLESGYLPPKKLVDDDEFEKRFGKTSVAQDGVGLDL